MYDQFGHAGVDGMSGGGGFDPSAFQGFEDIFGGGFSDIFENLFGGGFSSRSSGFGVFLPSLKRPFIAHVPAHIRLERAS